MPARDLSASAGDEQWALRLLRDAAVLVIVSQLAIAIPDLIAHPATARWVAALYALNVLIAATFAFLSSTEWMLTWWRPAALAGSAALIGGIAAISGINGSPEFLFTTAVLAPLAAGAVLPWSTKWQDTLAVVAITTFASVAIFGPLYDPSRTLHCVWVLTAAALSHFAVLLNQQRHDELHRERGKLVESEATLLKAIDSILDPLAINDLASARYVKVNDEFLRLTGLKREQVIGKTWADIQFRPDGGFAAEARQRLLREGAIRNVETTMHLRDGRTMPCLISCVLVEFGGRQCVLSVARDISELKATQLKLEAAGEAALAASRAKSEFLSSMSHEIRTPMNSILGMADLLAETPLTKEQRRFVDSMTKNGNVLLELINGILDLAKVESGKLHLEEHEFGLEELSRQVMETLSVRANEKGIDLSAQISPDVAWRVRGDPLRLRQVLINLVGNAIKFTEHGEVALTVQKSSDAEGQECFHFSVRDTGIGISPDRLDAIFQSFTQADSSTTRKYGGSGLGLAIARRLVELMGGRIWAESEIGRGSTFHFTVRLGVVEDERKKPEHAPILGEIRTPVGDGGSQPEAFGDRALVILLADDSRDNRLLIGAYLKNLPYELDVAEDGATAVQKYAARRYDLVLMDMQMPVMDGYGAVRKIRHWEREHGRAPTPIVALTASAFKEDARNSVEAGCTVHLSKPVKKASLLAVIRDLTGDSVATSPTLDSARDRDTDSAHPKLSVQ